MLNLTLQVAIWVNKESENATKKSKLSTAFLLILLPGKNLS